MRSSYAQNNFSAVFAQTVIMRHPALVVDLGLLDGYSLLAFGAGVSYLKRNYPAWRYEVIGYDLFDDYPYKHGSQLDIEAALKDAGFAEWVKVRQGDAFKVHEHFREGQIDLLHIDISNDGEKIAQLLELWTPKVKPFSGVVLMEGGTPARDAVWWMKEFNRPPILPVLESSFVKLNYQVPFVHTHFPGLTVLERRNGMGQAKLDLGPELQELKAVPPAQGGVVNINPVDAERFKAYLESEAGRRCVLKALGKEVAS